MSCVIVQRAKEAHGAKSLWWPCVQNMIECTTAGKFGHSIVTMLDLLPLWAEIIEYFINIFFFYLRLILTFAIPFQHQCPIKLLKMLKVISRIRNL